jgi:hypothetical protein
MSNRPYEVAAYCFEDVTFAVAGPNNLNAFAAGEAEEGFTIEFEGNKNTMTVGANGDVMHSLRVGQPGRLILRLLKTSSFNKTLSDNWTYQTSSAANHGLMTWQVTDAARGDTWTCSGCAFGNHASGQYAVVGNVQEWVFDVGRITPKLGAGTDRLVTN